jgi:hypothetical protein
MNLLGDPLLKIPYPQPIEVNLPSKATSGERIKISGQSAVSGRLIAEVSLVRDRVPQGVVPVRAYQGTEQENQQMDRNYQTANQLTVTSISQVIDAGRFEVELQIPSDSSGRHVVSVYVYGNREWSVGSQKLLVRKTP